MISKKALTVSGLLLVLVLTQLTSLSTGDAKQLVNSVLQVFSLLQDKPRPSTIDGVYRVTDVVDGDTIKVDLNGRKETIRLIGMDTPEVVDPRKPVQCFGREASAKAKAVLSGQSVQLVSDSTQGDRDKYERLLRYVFLSDGTLFNQMMIEEGYAHEYTYNSHPYQYQEAFQAAERAAREGEQGLWSADACHGVTQ